jgi:hypothetical protein
MESESILDDERRSRCWNSGRVGIEIRTMQCYLPRLGTTTRGVESVLDFEDAPSFVLVACNAQNLAWYETSPAKDCVLQDDKHAAREPKNG